MEHAWLDCRISKGMFSDELVVAYPADGESLAQVFVPMEYVDTLGRTNGSTAGLGKVKVNVIDVKKLVVEIPGEERKIIIANKSDITII